MPGDPLRSELVRLVEGRDARMSFEEAVRDFPEEAINQRPPNVGYTPWHLLEHVRLTQWDILDYVTNPEYVEREWPRDYWPDPSATATRADWDATIAAFQADMAALRDLVADEDRDLFAVIPGTPGHTLMREARIVADHNAYHIGEFAIVRQITGTWPADHE
jgi:hypothetical protein